MKVQMIYNHNIDTKQDSIKAFTSNKCWAKTYIETYKDLYLKEVNLNIDEYNKLRQNYGNKEIICYKLKYGIGVILIRRCDELELFMCGGKYDKA